ncbi:DUF3152 domain-containing protein [Winogradskya humida]|uniref:Lipoprotein n=1 Tax=Winogradskya humida TaxID=113566 RepID=A0ABQ3ZI03_9ACTN|nr:DUF3152 domain-containing protein [Actinoplanes humidus]GIE18178.1 lipoprotein [Actinoplanes humidus]
MGVTRVATAALTTAVAGGLGLAACGALPQVTSAMPAVSHAAKSPAHAPAKQVRPRPETITYPAQGDARWRTAPAAGNTGGDKGTLLRYRVVVESDIKGLNVRGFADAVATTLNDPRGWTAGGTLRLRRVGPGDAYDFTIYLATPLTRDRLCESGLDSYTSCRNGDKVVLNVARWVKGVPDFGASLATYRQYMVNHEVGHRLGHGHELCGGRGDPAPVMQQQTLGLHGCTANPWPYLDGERYAGKPGAYDDKVPAADRGVS